MFTIVCCIFLCVGLNIITNLKLKNPPQRLQQVSTINSRYQVHAPITLSGKKYALNNVYVLNKQVSKCVVMAFFSNNTVYFHLYLLVMDLCCFVHLAFVTRPLNIRLRKAWPELLLHGAEEPCTRQLVFSSYKCCALRLSPHFDISRRIQIFAFYNI